MNLKINHHCSTEKKFEDYKQGKLWRHLLFRVYSHDPCPETGMNESFLPVLTCNNLKKNYKNVLHSIKYRYPNLDKVLGTFSYSRFCTEDDEFLLTIQMITQATLISFNPRRKGRGSFLNRRLIKSLLPRKYRKFVNIARKLPLYKFRKENVNFLKDEENIHKFWQLCNSSDYIGDEIQNFFKDKNIIR